MKRHKKYLHGNTCQVRIIQRKGCIRIQVTPNVGIRTTVPYHLPSETYLRCRHCVVPHTMQIPSHSMKLKSLALLRIQPTGSLVPSCIQGPSEHSTCLHESFHLTGPQKPRVSQQTGTSSQHSDKGTFHGIFQRLISTAARPKGIYCIGQQ
jgi:hypothetical protein